MKDGMDSFQWLGAVSDDQQGQSTAYQSDGERGMNSSPYDEGTLVQQTTAKYLKQQLE
uniref:Uncharacterized protein n=1 Tax=Candidatus Methanogaster sp. ANME-2c ERB4 TaxID=2759911 RepID=A0A7G9YM79_9EURY|nr:hypothetical protein CPECMPGB_00033 [Methanosarcinales archaeon ANME-2c ERB4]QNO49150.1 hypothetical protein DBBAIPCH_00033 [Methanosarcinales archaeon ANME-2c ERB4]